MSPIWLVLIINALVVILIPVLAVPLLLITNSGHLMGKHKNGWISNTILVILILVAMHFTYTNGIDLLSSLARGF